MSELGTPIPQPKEAVFSEREAAIYAGDLLLELRNLTFAHPRLKFLTYLIEMAFQEAFNLAAKPEMGKIYRNG